MNKIERAESILGLKVKGARWNATAVISPEQAKRILEAQPQQRHVVAAHVKELADTMLAGRFVLTNEGLAFDEDGMLFDGQHRMWACFNSGVAVSFLCCFNEPRANFENIGTLVRRRSYGDQLVIAGVISDSTLANTIAAVARFIWSYDTGNNPTQSSVQKGWCPASMTATMSVHPGIADIATFFKSKRKMSLPLAPLIGLAVLMQEAHPQKSAIFFHQITSGEGLESGSPALTLRESAMGRHPSKRGFRTDMTYCIVRAWNAFYEDRTILRLFGSNSAGAMRSRVGGLDTFPRVAGYTPANSKKKLPAAKAVSNPTLFTAARSSVAPSQSVSP